MDSAIERYEKVTSARKCAFCRVQTPHGAYWKKDNTKFDVLARMATAPKPWGPAFISKLLSSLTYLCGKCAPPATDVAAVKALYKRERTRPPTDDAASLRGKVRAIRQRARQSKGTERIRLYAMAYKYEKQLLKAPTDNEFIPPDLED